MQFDRSWLFALIIGCGARPIQSNATAAVIHDEKPALAEPTENERLELFASVTQHIRMYHRFSDHAFARVLRRDVSEGLARATWETLIPEMEQEFVHATTRSALLLALRRLAATTNGPPNFQFPFLAPLDQHLAQVHQPHETLRVVRAGVPVAMLVGARCASSCDTVASWFSRAHLGPVLGEETSLMYTTLRMRMPISLGMWGSLGTFAVAFSVDRYGDDGPLVEGNPFPIELVPETEANRDNYGALLVERAKASLQTFSIPRT